MTFQFSLEKPYGGCPLNLQRRHKEGLQCGRLLRAAITTERGGAAWRRIDPRPVNAGGQVRQTVTKQNDWLVVWIFFPYIGNNDPN